MRDEATLQTPNERLDSIRRWGLLPCAASWRPHGSQPDRPPPPWLTAFYSMVPKQQRAIGLRQGAAPAFGSSPSSSSDFGPIGAQTELPLAEACSRASVRQSPSGPVWHRRGRGSNLSGLEFQFTHVYSTRVTETAPHSSSNTFAMLLYVAASEVGPSS